MYQVIKLDGFLDEVVDVTDGPYARKFCFFLGAGASVTSGIPSATKLVDLWDEKIRARFPAEEYEQWKNDKKIDENNKYSHYSDYYEKQFSSNPVDGYNFLEKKMKEASPSGGYACLAFLLTQTPHKVVVTTNFDRLTEDAVTLYAHEFSLVVGHVTMAHYITGEIARPTVVKIHHDLLLDPKSKNAELKKLDERWQKALSEIFSKYHPIFIGFAGNDPDVMDYLIENADKFREGNGWKRPYWTVYGDGKPEGKVENFLNKADAFLIRNNGFDDMMAKLALALNVKIPTEKDYQEDAKKQCNKLQDAIAKVQKGSKVSPGGSENNSPAALGSSSENAPISPRTVSGPLQGLSETPATGLLQSEQDASDTTLYLRAMVLHNDKHYQESLALLQELIRRDPDNARYHDSLSDTYHALGKYEEALAESRKALELEPDNAEYHNSCGVTLSTMGRHKEALAEKQKAVTLEPDNAEYHNSCGVTLHAMGLYKDALPEKQKAVALEPDNARYYDSLGVTLYEMGRYDEALNEEQKAVALEPDNAKYHDGLSTAYHAMGKYEEALAESRKAVELEPDNARYHNSLGVTLHETKRYDEALAEKQKAIALEPDNAEYHSSCGVTLHAMGRYKDALPEKQKAVALEPDNARYRNNLGVTLHEMGRYEDALPEKQKAVALEPNNAVYHNNLGMTLHIMGRYDEALDEEEKAVALESDNAGYRNCLSATLRTVGRYEEALTEEQWAIALEPNNAKYHNNCGITLHALGRYLEATNAYKKAIALDPKCATYYRNLAQTYKKMGLRKETAQAEEKAKQLRNSSPTD